jgi:isoleucyl-tRNA synthetase
MLELITKPNHSSQELHRMRFDTEHPMAHFFEDDSADFSIDKHSDKIVNNDTKTSDVWIDSGLSERIAVRRERSQIKQALRQRIHAALQTAKHLNRDRCPTEI